MEYILAYKPIGLTPLEHINELKENNELPKDKKTSYVGRLDPMAHGLMVYLIGETCKKQELYQTMSKKYIFKIVLGIETDTYDILGIIKNTGNSIIDEFKFNKQLQNFVGNYDLPYPPFSSKRVNGKCLWEHALNNKLDEIIIPSNNINVKSLKIINSKIINYHELKNNIIHKINLMKSKTFRNQDIIKEWNNLKLNNRLSLFEVEADVSSGTYIRSICHYLGTQLDTYAIAYDIFRIKLGNYVLE